LSVDSESVVFHICRLLFNTTVSICVLGFLYPSIFKYHPAFVNMTHSFSLPAAFPLFRKTWRTYSIISSYFWFLSYLMLSNAYLGRVRTMTEQQYGSLWFFKPQYYKRKITPQILRTWISNNEIITQCYLIQIKFNQWIIQQSISHYDIKNHFENTSRFLDLLHISLELDTHEHQYCNQIKIKLNCFMSVSISIGQCFYLLYLKYTYLYCIPGYILKCESKPNLWWIIQDI
jgi:hypothetical protein